MQPFPWADWGRFPSTQPLPTPRRLSPPTPKRPRSRRSLRGAPPSGAPRIAVTAPLAGILAKAGAYPHVHVTPAKRPPPRHPPLAPPAPSPLRCPYDLALEPNDGRTPLTEVASFGVISPQNGLETPQNSLKPASSPLGAQE